MEQNTTPKRDFNHFASRINQLKSRAPLGSASYNRYGYHELRSVSLGSLTLKEIQDILESGDLTALRQLSYYFYRTSGIYRNAILFLAHLPLYQTVVMPIFDTTKKQPQKPIIERYMQVLKFVDNLEAPINFARATQKVLVAGTYYGILREDHGNFTLQDLPEAYCRTRFKDCYNQNTPEFDLRYFDTITDKAAKLEAIAAYPAVVVQAWRKYSTGKTNDPWVPISAANGGCCFQYHDATPLYIASIPEIYRLSEAIEREAKRDENALYKLLIERMPIDSKGQLVFQLDETADIHASVANMLADVDTVDVLTTFGDTSLESLQDSSSATQSADRLDKYTNSAYNSLGLPRSYFNTENSTALPFANAKDEAIVQFLLEQYGKWIEVQVNLRFAKSNLTFDVSFLQTTRMNRQEMQSQYFKAAQYGYSKMQAGVAMGIKQINMIPAMIFENDFLHMDEKMKPLMSSFTSSGKENKNNQTTTNTDSTDNLINSDGRANDEESDRAQENDDGKN